MLENLKNLNDLGEAIKKAFKEVGPDAIRYVSAIRLKESIISLVVLTIFVIGTIICLPWGIDSVTAYEDTDHGYGCYHMCDSAPWGGIVILIFAIIGVICSFIWAESLVQDVGRLMVNWRSPQADAVSFWAHKFTN